ncbi:MAG TPA: hypothetical protein VK041_08655 [Opitutales bacterium]|nr:hypothetical protein [Opitutales bacterium]
MADLPEGGKPVVDLLGVEKVVWRLLEREGGPPLEEELVLVPPEVSVRRLLVSVRLEAEWPVLELPLEAFALPEPDFLLEVEGAAEVLPLLLRFRLQPEVFELKAPVCSG